MAGVRAASLLLVPLLCGCNHVQLNGGSLYVAAGPAAVAVVGAAVLAANIDARNDFSAGTALTLSTPAPAMVADRTVGEQDCTKPIEDWSANLKCR